MRVTSTVDAYSNNSFAAWLKKMGRATPPGGSDRASKSSNRPVVVRIDRGALPGRSRHGFQRLGGHSARRIRQRLSFSSPPASLLAGGNLSHDAGDERGL